MINIKFEHLFDTKENRDLVEKLEQKFKADPDYLALNREDDGWKMYYLEKKLNAFIGFISLNPIVNMEYKRSS